MKTLKDYICKHGTPENLTAEHTQNAPESCYLIERVSSVVIFLASNYSEFGVDVRDNRVIEDYEFQALACNEGNR
jgi:hypothetical protein